MTRTFRRLVALAATSTILLGTIGAAPAAAVGPAGGERAAATSDALRGHGRCAPLWVTASATPTVENWKAVGLCEVDRRLETIGVLSSVVEHASVLTDAHAAALDTILDDTAAGLRALRAEVEADTTLPELREDIGRIATEFRVYVLVARQVHLVVGADAVDAAVARFGPAIESLEDAIDAAEAAGRDVTRARELLAGLVEDVEAAEAAVAGVADAVLPLTPADWNDGAAEPILREARQDLVTARTHLREAMRAARAILSGLR